ncbi:MAG: DUF58 domain-containing protein [Cystobacterineae bacterium]|nr:DUF58 domain-containing protein [Cystobacterineae bacterium]
MALFSKWKAPRQLKTTRIGKIYIALSLGIGVAALNTGNNLLYLMLGLLLSFIVSSGILSEINIRHLSLNRVLPNHPRAGEECTLLYEVQNNKGFSFAIELHEKNKLFPAKAFLASTNGKQAALVAAKCNAPRRGPLRLDEIQISTRFPFGLFIKTRNIHLPETLLVLPKRIHIQPQALLAHSPKPFNGNLNTHIKYSRNGSGDIWGVINLQAESDAKHIHWLKSAASGKLMQMLRENENAHVYMLQLETSHSLSALDAQCEKLAALALWLLRHGHHVELQTPTQTLKASFGPAHEKRILQTLAWAGFNGEEA